MRLFIQQSAEDDILRQVEWYAEHSISEIARRFRLAAVEAIQALADTPFAGAPKLVNNLLLSGLRTWPVAGFDEFRIYYIP